MRVTAAATQAEWTVFAAYHYGGSGREDWVMPPLQRRLAGQPLRAYFMAKMAEWALVGLPGYRSWRWQYGRRARLLRRQLPFIFECIITIQYLHNQILDGKSGVVTPARINSNLLAANLLKDQLMRYLDGELPASVRPRVKAAVHRCFAWVDYGQHLEKSTNLGPGTTEVPAWADCLPEPLRQSMDLTAAEPFLRKIKADLPAIHHEVVDTYFHRIYLTCAFLFTEGANLLIQLLRPSARVATAMRGFSLNYGLMRQLVNDNADWLPRSLALATQARRADDAFSDLRNGTLTLPLIYFRAEHPHGNLLALLGRRDALAEVEENRYFAEMLHSHALYKSIQNTRILGELAVAFLPTDQQAGQWLADTCEIVHWNRFLAPCLRHPAYAEYRRTTYYQRTRRLIRQLRRQREWQPLVAPVATTNLMPERVRQVQALLLAALPSHPEA